MKKYYKPMLSFIFISMLFIIAGCEKESSTNNLEKPIIIVLSVTDPNPDYMGSTTVAWDVTGEYERVSVSVNGEVISTEPKDTKTIYNIITDQVVVVSVLKKGETDPVKERRYTISPKPEIIPSAPVVSFTSNLTSIIRGESITFNWDISGQVDSLKSNLPGFSGMTGTIQIAPIESTTYSVFAYGKGGVDSKTISITVNEPPIPTRADTLCYAPWKRYKLFFRSSLEAPWVEADISYCGQDDLYTFYLPHTIEVKHGPILCGGEPPFVSGYWDLNGSILTVDESTFYIETLTIDTLTWISETSYLVKEVFVH